MCSFSRGNAAPDTRIVYPAPPFARAARRRTLRPWLFARAALYYAAASLRRSRASRRSMHQCLIRKPAKKKASLVARRAALARFFAPKLQCSGETTFSLLPNDLHLLALREAHSAARNNALLLARPALLLKLLAQLPKAQGLPGGAQRTNRRHRRLGRAGRTGPR